MDSPAAPLPGDADRFQENSGGACPADWERKLVLHFLPPPHPTICLGPFPGLPAPKRWFCTGSMNIQCRGLIEDTKMKCVGISSS